MSLLFLCSGNRSRGTRKIPGRNKNEPGKKFSGSKKNYRKEISLLAFVLVSFFSFSVRKDVVFNRRVISFERRQRWLFCALIGFLGWKKLSETRLRLAYFNGKLFDILDVNFRNLTHFVWETASSYEGSERNPKFK